MSPVMLWCVIFRTGGTENFQWRRSLPVLTEEDALQLQAAVRQMGYPALAVDYRQSLVVGLPTTFDAESF